MIVLLSLSAVPGFDAFYDNFVNINDVNNRENLASPSIRKGLRPNASLDDARRLFTLSGGPNVLNLTSSGAFQSSTSIGGVYMCRASNQFGTRNQRINITVKGEYK